MGFTKHGVAALTLRMEQPTKGTGEILAVFVPGKLRNPMNGTHGHWSKHARWAKTWRERTCWAVFESAYRGAGVVGVNMGRMLLALEMQPDRPKVVTFHAIVPSKFDDDNLPPCCKPIRDALKDMGVINDDRTSAGHTFVYEQEAKRARVIHGVFVRVKFAELVPAGEERRC